MPRGGYHPPGPGKKQGRPKLERAVDPGIAAKVLAKQRSEQLWNEIVQTDAAIMRETKNTKPLREDLEALEERAYGKAPQGIDLNAHVTIDAARREHIRDLISRLAGKS